MVVKFHMEGCHITHRYKLSCYLQCIVPHINFISKTQGVALLLLLSGQSYHENPTDAYGANVGNS